jgi:phage tail-like protein
MAFRGVKADPVRNFKFSVSFDMAPPGSGKSRAGFSSVSGLKESTEVVEYREGTEPSRMRKLFGQTSFDDVTLVRGLTTDREFISWRRAIVDVTIHSNVGGFAGAAPPFGEGTSQAASLNNFTGIGDFLRRDVEIRLWDYHNEGGDDGLWAWTLNDAWPNSLEIGEFSGDGNDVVLETVVLSHEGLEVRTPL